MSSLRGRKAAAALGFALIVVGLAAADSRPPLQLDDGHLRLAWQHAPDGWHLREIAAVDATGAVAPGTPAGEYCFLYSPDAPGTDPIGPSWPAHPERVWPEPIYDKITKTWAQAREPVAMNIAGTAFFFYPTEAKRNGERACDFAYANDVAELRALWRLDAEFPGDVVVALTLTAKKTGYYSMATPTVARVAPADLQWATVPGYFQGAKLETDLVAAYAYGHGLPALPVVVRERAASSLTSILTTREGVTLAVTAAPGTAADPWEDSRDTRQMWRLGLSHMNRRGELAPTLYHPVLGQDASRLAAGESRTFHFRYTVRKADWFAVLKHVIADVYQLPRSLELKSPTSSLTQRLQMLQRYVVDAQTSRWRTERFGGRTIGAQAYLGTVVGSQGDAMKNSDYGAMAMLAALTKDPVLMHDRLPTARAFKLAQQQAAPGFFQGAATGQYYLSKSRRFVEEWGNYVEPIAVTYYSMADIGNLLRFAPDDAELRERLRLGAERLIAWQHDDGHWDVAYDEPTQRPLFPDLLDRRPTFYGLLIAHQILGDARYLAAAKRGADWLIRNAVEPGAFLGVCGDTRFAPDFATAQTAQALLDLYAATHDLRYRDAAIATARIYVGSIFSHPAASRKPKRIHDQIYEDWQVNQAGLGFEHGGVMGSAAWEGPILLASHAGLFLRIFALTGESLFRDLARAAAVGREAFVNPSTGVASYYWRAMHEGAGPFPHHAWWQIGWIVDYLLSEASVRSGNQISFPRGFMAPKVGPHAAYGFAPGRVHGEPAQLSWSAWEPDIPGVDCLVAHSLSGARTFLILMNERAAPIQCRLAPDPRALTAGRSTRWEKVAVLEQAAARVEAENDPPGPIAVALPAHGLAIVRLDAEN